jgi:hypothetical protein
MRELQRRLCAEQSPSSLRSLPAPNSRSAAGRPRVDSRDQARRLPDLGAPAGTRRAPGHAQWPRPSGSLPARAAAIEPLPVSSRVVDGEAIVCDDDGLAVFNLIRGHGRNGRAILCAFDLLEVNGEDIRR